MVRPRCRVSGGLLKDDRPATAGSGSEGIPVAVVIGRAQRSPLTLDSAERQFEQLLALHQSVNAD